MEWKDVSVYRHDTHSTDGLQNVVITATIFFHPVCINNERGGQNHYYESMKKYKNVYYGHYYIMYQI